MPDIENMPKPPSPPPKDPSTPTSLPIGEGGGAGEDSEGGDDVRGRQLTPLDWSTDATEEVADTHLSIICKFMTDDQVGVVTVLLVGVVTCTTCVGLIN